MDWLRAYEGERGIAYVVVIASAIAPSTLALYWLDPKQFFGVAWPSVLFLSLSIGLLLILLTFAGTMAAEETLRKRLESNGKKRDQSLMIGLIVGSATALVTQLIAFAYTSSEGKSFNDFVSLSFALTFLFVIGDMLTALAKLSLAKNRRMGKTKTKEE